MTVKVSDHALVRWLERAHDIDMENFRSRLVAIAAPYAAARVKHVEIGGLWFVFEGALLVTIVPNKPDMHSLHKNDRGSRNCNYTPDGPLPWQAKKRRRDHR